MPIEDAVKAETAIISNAMLLGDKLKFLSMMLTLKVNLTCFGILTCFGGGLSHVFFLSNKIMSNV